MFAVLGILTLTVQQQLGDRLRESKLRLVDLAGNERWAPWPGGLSLMIFDDCYWMLLILIRFDQYNEHYILLYMYIYSLWHRCCILYISVYDVHLHKYIYMVPPPKKKKTYLFTMFTCIYGVFLHILGGYVLRFLNKFGHSFEGEYHIYI